MQGGACAPPFWQCKFEHVSNSLMLHVVYCDVPVITYITIAVYYSTAAQYSIAVQVYYTNTV